MTWITPAEGVKLFAGDFREAGIVEYDHLISDPPYEQRSHDSTGSIRRADGVSNPARLNFGGVDNIRTNLCALGEKAKGWLLLFCTTEGVALWRDEIEAHGIKYKTPCIWIKPDAMPKFNGQGPSHGHECIVTAWAGKGYSKWNGGGRRGTFTHNTNSPDRDGRHQTEKPISLMMELVQLFTNPGDTVCDPCMGSGTTGVACIKLGRKFIGCEIDKNYFDIALERITSALSQPDFFVAIPDKLRQGKFDV